MLTQSKVVQLFRRYRKGMDTFQQFMDELKVVEGSGPVNEWEVAIKELIEELPNASCNRLAKLLTLRHGKSVSTWTRRIAFVKPEFVSPYNRSEKEDEFIEEAL